MTFRLWRCFIYYQNFPPKSAGKSLFKEKAREVVWDSVASDDLLFPHCRGGRGPPLDGVRMMIMIRLSNIDQISPQKMLEKLHEKARMIYSLRGREGATNGWFQDEDHDERGVMIIVDDFLATF